MCTSAGYKEVWLHDNRISAHLSLILPLLKGQQRNKRPNVQFPIGMGA